MIEDGRWYRYEPGRTVLDFSRMVIAVGSCGMRVMPAPEVGAHRTEFVFVIPRIPKETPSD